MDELKFTICQCTYSAAKQNKQQQGNQARNHRTMGTVDCFYILYSLNFFSRASEIYRFRFQKFRSASREIDIVTAEGLSPD